LEEVESDIGRESELETIIGSGKAAAESILAITVAGKATTESILAGEGKSCKIGDVVSDGGYTSVESRIESVKACGDGAKIGAGETKGRAAGGGAELDSFGVMLGGRGNNTSAEVLSLKGSCCLA
jgi:hypothetical protein